MRERWRVASAELARVLRLNPTALVEPLEPPHLLVTFVPANTDVEDLIEMGLRSRPELASYQALVDAALHKWREERLRPFLPYLLLRGGGTQTPYPMAFGAYGGGTGGSLNNFQVRSDWDLQVLWELRNFGLGNLGVIRQRRAEHEAADMQFGRMRDFVAREIVQAYAQVQAAAERMCQAEKALREAIISANENYEGLGKTKRVGGNINILIIRPQEVLAAIQELSQAYFNYFGVAADYNRAQFRLYRAMGNPAHLLNCPPPGKEVACSPPPETPGSGNDKNPEPRDKPDTLPEPRKLQPPTDNPAAANQAEPPPAHGPTSKEVVCSPPPAETPGSGNDKNPGPRDKPELLPEPKLPPSHNPPAAIQQEPPPQRGPALLPPISQSGVDADLMLAPPPVSVQRGTP